MNEYLTGYKIGIKNIGGRSFRINNLKQQKKMNYIEEDEIKKDVREFKLLNLKKMESIYSDEESSDDSKNKSFDDDIYLEENYSEQDFIDVDSFLLYLESNPQSMIKNNNNNNKQIKPKFLWTHFLAFPFFKNKDFVDKFGFFKSTILNENFANINEHMFQNENRLHLTICLFQLKNKEQIALVEKLIKESESEINEITQNISLALNFDQFDMMGDQKKTRVLYTKPDSDRNESTEKIKDIIDVLLTKFIKNDILTKEMLKYSNIAYNQITERYENQKLHVTLLNITFLLRELSKNNKEDNYKPYFNGQNILKKMKHFNFGMTSSNNIVLLEMKTDKNGNYNQVMNFKI